MVDWSSWFGMISHCSHSRLRSLHYVVWVYDSVPCGNQLFSFQVSIIMIKRERPHVVFAIPVDWLRFQLPRWGFVCGPSEVTTSSRCWVVQVSTVLHHDLKLSGEVKLNMKDSAGLSCLSGGSHASDQSKVDKNDVLSYLLRCCMPCGFNCVSLQGPVFKEHRCISPPLYMPLKLCIVLITWPALHDGICFKCLFSSGSQC